MDTMVAMKRNVICVVTVHLINLVEFENRMLVLLQWAWNYLTRNRAARLITEQRAVGQ